MRNEITKIDWEYDSITMGWWDYVWLDNIVLMQYTWLTDIVWKKIYDWDIISEEWVYVVWDEKLWCWSFTFKWDDIQTPLFHNTYAMRVIWNRYENPDLLDKKL